MSGSAGYGNGGSNRSYNTGVRVAHDYVGANGMHGAGARRVAVDANSHIPSSREAAANLRNASPIANGPSESRGGMRGMSQPRNI